MINNINLYQKSLAIVDCMYLPLNPAKSCQGGSETWILEVAKIFTENDWHVVVFANVQSVMIYNNIEFVPFNILSYRCRYQIFDIVIYSRSLLFTNDIISKHSYMIFHDMSLIRPISNIDMPNLKNIERFYVLSEYAKKYVKNNTMYIPDNKLFIIHNGINYNLYKNIENKENSMVWSSRKERGFNYFVNYIMPDILVQVPDFILHVCSYEKYTYEDINTDMKSHIIFHNCLSKEDLAKLQCKSKIWCYPNLGYDDNNTIFFETFCISAIENLAANNIIIAGDFGGLQSTLQGYPLLGKDFYINNKIPIDKKTEYGKYLANYCINALLNKYNPVYNGDKFRFTWENVFLEFTKNI